ncbi:MAG TPA: M48 family metalloprotease [Burkholderiales bacterium]|nr:M48 family metalloprotease [Burkholderiales bacterium]
MTNEEFSALVSRLEEQSRDGPRWYRVRVTLLAILGYGYVGIVLALLIVLSLATLASAIYLKAAAIKIAIPILVVVGLVLKAMWVRLPPPEGRALDPREVPALFEMIERLRRKLKAPRFHRVLLTGDFNAAVVQLPLLGMFGWHRNYLLIGLPLMKALTREQFEAVLAHEFGHLARGHARVSNWIYRLRMTWARLVSALEERQSWGTFLFRPFFNWYAPYFSAYSFPLARANEYEADATAARLVSPAALGQALTAVNVIASYLGENYWPRIYSQADDLPQPRFAPFSALGGRLASDLREETSVRGWLDQAIARATTVDDTHPGLSDRVKAIGEKPRFAPPAVGQAADRLLGEMLAGLTEEFDRDWREHIQPSWEQRHHDVQKARSRLAELDALAAAAPDGELALREAYERARLTESVGPGPDPALEQFRRLHERAPGDPSVSLSLGLRLLARDEEAGFPLVEQAMREDEENILPGCEALRDYCWRMKREQEAHAWHKQLVERAELLELARKERAELHVRDALEEHGLPEEAVARLRQQLQRIPGLRKAYLVRKRVEHLSHHPLYVLGHVVSPWWKPHRKKLAATVQQAILDNVSFPGETLIISVEGENARFSRKLRRVTRSRIL